MPQLFNPTPKKMGFRITRRSLVQVSREFRIIQTGMHQILDSFHWLNMSAIYNRAHATTMFATGELQSKLFKVRRQDPNGSLQIVGYDSTSNDQSVAQEFDLGKVHRQAKQHLHKLAGFGREEERAKCSRVPVDLWAFTTQYGGNPKARRRALARSIEDQLETSVTHAVKSGGNLFYRPNLKAYEHKLNVFTANTLNVLFGG